MLTRLAFFTSILTPGTPFAIDRTCSIAPYLAFDSPGEAYTVHQELPRSGLLPSLPRTC